MRNDRIMLYLGASKYHIVPRSEQMNNEKMSLGM